MELPGGLTLRSAAAPDLDQIADLVAARGDAADAVDLRLVAGDASEGLDAIGVVVDRDRVVSTATLLRETVFVEDVAVPAGQIELVATDPDYEGRGLVRALMSWAHEQSARRGDLLQIMIGIPYFYRRFGYAYTTPIPLVRSVAEIPETVPTIRVRAATRADIPAMAALQDRAQSGREVRMPHSQSCWGWLTERDGSTQWVAEQAGEIVGTARTTPPEEGLILAELAVDVEAAAWALLAHAVAIGDGAAMVQERPGTIGFEAVEPCLEDLTGPDAIADWYYARVERIGPLLLHLGPVLAARLDRAGMAGTAHDVLLSTWGSHVRFRVGSDGVTGLTEGGPEQRPVSKGGSGVPPDGVAPLLLGPWGAAGLEERLPDCWLGRQRALMAALFPPLHADLLTFYLPV